MITTISSMGISRQNGIHASLPAEPQNIAAPISSKARPKKVRGIIKGALDRYVGSTEVDLIGDELLGWHPRRARLGHDHGATQD